MGLNNLIYVVRDMYSGENLGIFSTMEVAKELQNRLEPSIETFISTWEVLDEIE